MRSRHVNELLITSLVPYEIAVVGPAVAKMAQRLQAALQSYLADTPGRATKAFEKAGIKPAEVVTVDGHHLVVDGTHTVMASAEAGLDVVPCQVDVRRVQPNYSSDVNQNLEAGLKGFQGLARVASGAERDQLTRRLVKQSASEVLAEWREQHEQLGGRTLTP